MKELAEHLQTPMINLLLSIADDKLFLGHRNSDWTGIAPILEADIAFSSLAQDDIAHASAMYELHQLFQHLIRSTGLLRLQDSSFAITLITFDCSDLVRANGNPLHHSPRG